MPVLIAFVIAVSWLAGIYKGAEPPKEEVQIDKNLFFVGEGFPFLGRDTFSTIQ